MDATAMPGRHRTECALGTGRDDWRRPRLTSGLLFGGRYIARRDRAAR